MKKKVTLYAAALLIISSLFGFPGERAREEKPGHSFFTAAIFYPLSTNKSKKHHTNLNLSLFYGHVGRVDGFDLGIFASAAEDGFSGVQLTGMAGIAGGVSDGVQVSGIFNVAGERFTGVQAAGIGNIGGDDFSGLQGAGIFNIVGDELRGVQAAGIFNIVGENFKGIQAAGIFNITGSSFKGIQGGGLFNITGEHFRGIQAADIFNITGGDASGLQASAIFNVGGGEFRGLQVSGVNVAAALKGVQVGLVNIAGKASGVQVGLVNYTKEEIKGVPVGLVNIAKNSRLRLTAWAGSLTAVNVGIKSLVRNVYSLFYLGTVNWERDIDQSLAYGYQLGLHHPFKRLFIDVDLGFSYIDNDKLFHFTSREKDQFVIKARAILGIDLSRKLSLFAGGGVGYMWDYGERFDSGKYVPLFLAGLELF